MAWLADLPLDLVLLSGDRATLRAYHHVLLADAVHALNGMVLVLDGAHCINPHEVGYHHLMHGCPADYAADRVPLHDLAVSITVTRDPDDYTSNTLTAAALRQLRCAGIDVAPGRLVQYVVQRGRPGTPAVQRVAALDLLYNREPVVDRVHYRRLLERSLDDLLAPLTARAAEQTLRDLDSTQAY